MFNSLEVVIQKCISCCLVGSREFSWSEAADDQHAEGCGHCEAHAGLPPCHGDVGKKPQVLEVPATQTRLSMGTSEPEEKFLGNPANF